MAAHAVSIEPGKDPVPSVMWAFYHKQMLGDAPFVFDDRVKLHAPPFAEDARQVPLEIDARAFKGAVISKNQAGLLLAELGLTVR